MRRVRAHHVHVEHHFGKPPEAIFAYLAEHENLASLFGAKIKRLRDGEGGERNGQEIELKGQRLAVKIAAGDDLVAQNYGIVGHRIQLNRKRAARLR